MTEKSYKISAIVWQAEYIVLLENLLRAFRKTINSIKQDQEIEIEVLLSKKVNSNCFAAMELFCRGFILEGFSLLRSAIETAIYIQYLRLYPKEKTEYINSSRLFNVKNSFIILKGMFSTGDEHHYGKHAYDDNHA